MAVLDKIGVRGHHPTWLQERIKTANKVFAILFGVLMVLFFMSLVFWTTVMTMFVGGSVVILGVTIGVHATGFHFASRLLISTLPVLVASCIQGAYQVKGQLPNASGWIFIAAFQVLPFLLFAPSEKRFRIIAVVVNLILSAMYEKFNSLIEIQIPEAPPIQVLITNMIGLSMMLQLLYAIDGLYIRSSLENKNLVGRIAQEKSEQEAARQALDKTVAALNEARVEEEKRTWITRGVAEASRILRDDGDPAGMYDRIISFVVKYIEANQGGIFTATQEGDDQCFELRACYAYERKRFLEKRIPSGEGLVGQCFYDHSVVYMTDVPADYVRITSGLGLATPRAILIVPMLVNQQVLGVIELASLKKFEPYQIEFLKEIGETVAMALNNIRANERTRTLLEESNLIAEQMRLQEETMRQSMEEIVVQQESQARIEEELRQQLQEHQQEIAELKERLQLVSSHKNSIQQALV